MACFLLPKPFCSELEGVMAKFWWQKGPGKKGIHWCSWKQLSESKEMRGLRFRDLSKFNIALLAKQWWRLFNYLDSLLARVMKAKYYSNVDFLNSSLENLPSYTWKSIWAAKGLLSDGLC